MALGGAAGKFGREVHAALVSRACIGARRT